MGKLNPFFKKIHLEIKVRKEIFTVTKHLKFDKRRELKRGTIASVSTKIGSNFRFKGKRALIQQLETIEKKITQFDLTQLDRSWNRAFEHFDKTCYLSLLNSFQKQRNNLKNLVDFISFIYNLNYIPWSLRNFNILIFIRKVILGRI